MLKKVSLKANAGGKQDINYKVHRMVVKWSTIYIAAHTNDITFYAF